MQKRRRINYRFTERNHSGKGIISLIAALLSVIVIVGMLVLSFQSKGNGSIYLGSGGILALLIAIAAFILAIFSMREEYTYKLFAIVAILVSILVLAGGVALYIIGFLRM